jgi:hypothetical protein
LVGIAKYPLAMADIGAGVGRGWNRDGEVAWEQEACETDNPDSKNEVGLPVPAMVAGRAVLVEASDEMVACDIRFTMVGESMGRERGTVLPDLDRP